ncbi:MAG TPA: ATP-binding protein [Brevundimonas sp.]|uniref:hybrid sensor histidine kinase/response regulator n=1 Tax=Brevundimonas sp. TaxID=1871086 RepID=UPI002626AE0D|nr:ATP-binding protein [Brevundimonas sp.]HRO32875.1 ATP-binding protein [Brevundimonas sp.]
MLVLMGVIALALSMGWAGVWLALRARTQARRHQTMARTLESQVAERTARLALALQAADEQAAALAAADRIKSDFLAAMSHELRTPLNAVIGFAELMRIHAASEPLTFRQRQAVDQILGAGSRLLALIDEVLDLARLEAGTLNVACERVDPHLVARQVCDAFRHEAEQNGVGIEAPPPTAGLGVQADRTRLRQVLTQLVSNAVRYNRPGGRVLVEVRQDAAAVTLAVRDTGPGVPPERMAELFQPFNRLGREGSAIAGAGVGLIVARRLAEAMKGRLEADSVVGEGSVFTLRLPPARAVSAPVTASPLPDLTLPPATVLYVEDNPSNVALMRHVAAALGPLQVHVAETGRDGLMLARDLAPDVIILDIALPDIDGYAVKAALDADPLTAAIPVLALSAGAMPADLRRGREAGFHAYLTKPLDIPALARALSQVLARRGDVAAA